MRKALRDCRKKTVQFKKYDDGDLGKHLGDVVLDGNPYSNWLTLDDEGWEQRRNSIEGQKYQALIKQTKNPSKRNTAGGTPEGFRAYADEIVASIDELLMHLNTPFAEP